MAKDAKGHGSNKRDTMKAIRAIGMSARINDGEWRVNHPGGKEATAYYTENNTDALDTARHMAGHGGDRAAAAQLAEPGHSKSEPVPVHAGAAGRLNAWGQNAATAKSVRRDLRMSRKLQLHKPPSQRRHYP